MSPRGADCKINVFHMAIKLTNRAGGKIAEDSQVMAGSEKSL